MILAAGLTPAWQQILVFDRMLHGEVNRAREARWCGSGKVLNVGRALAGLWRADSHSKCLTLSPLGGPARDPIEQEFYQDGIPLHVIPVSTPTRVCTTLLEQTTGVTTELVENAAEFTKNELNLYAEKFTVLSQDANCVVLSGSLPAKTPANYYARLLNDYRGKIILDARGDELLSVLPLKPWFIKPNRAELARTFGRDSLTDDTLCQAMRELNQKGATWVLVSAGENALWLTSVEQTWRFEPPCLQHVANPIGSGDTLAAGIAWSTALGREPADSVRWGIAAAAANAETLLPARWLPGRVEELFEKVVITRIS